MLTVLRFGAHRRVLRGLLIGAAVAACLLLKTGCASGGRQQLDSATAPEQSAAAEVTFELLAEGIWMHTSYHEIAPWGLVRSNGLIVVSKQDVVLVDTAWNDAQTDEILQWTSRTLGRSITKAVFTHSHADKMGGVGALRARGVDTFAIPLSNDLAEERGLTPAAVSLDLTQVGDSVSLGPVEVYYPGPGHTRDNIVVSISSKGVLFGGCLIRPGASDSLGNVADADVDHWAQAVQNAATRYPSAHIVIPSHGPPGDRSLLQHTIELASHSSE